jgi:two-component system, LuxR family, response regulator FixJ
VRTIYIVDDQEAVRDALGEMLSVFGFDVETYRSAEAFLDVAATRSGGCVVADVRMEGMDGIALVQELGDRGIALPVILISGHADVPMAVSAIKSGAEDFIEKPVDDAKLVAAINRALARASAEATQRGSQAAVADAFGRLTPRQIEIFDLVAAGYTSQAIALRLDLSVRTVESYRAQVMEKMQAESVAVVVRQALKLGRIAP